MKVLNFLEFCKLSEREQSEYYRAFTDTKGILFIPMGAKIFQEWYMEIMETSFSPELRTELFQGWKKDEDNPVLYYLPERFNIEFYDIHYEILDVEKDFLYTLPTPKLFEDFIRDCQRAGIELKWRGQ